jgi:hypothetical protein
MLHRITLLAFALFCMGALAANAATAATAPAASQVPAAVAAMPAPATGPGWLTRPQVDRTVEATAADGPLGSIFALTCVQQCLQSGEDLICCRYICHPIGMNPC